MRKVISIILTICMLTILSLTPVHVNAQTPAEQPTVTENTESNGVVAEATAEPKVWQNPLEENIYTKIVDNGDGTKTLTLYDYPVRFVNEKGRLQDISLEIAADSDGNFKTLAAESQTVFPKAISDGITLSGNGVSLKMTPAKPVSSGKLTASTEKFSSLSSAVTKVDNQKVAYAYDSKTALEYQLTYTGFKEDIVVSEYTGQTEYSFLLETNGLALTKIDESYFLTDEKGEIKATIGDIIIFTADERNNTLGSMTYTVVKENEQYIMTIHVDAEYLKDEKTKYPIRIDPTIEINYDNNGAGGIEDAVIYSDANTNGSSGSLYVGLRENYGITRTLIQFPTIDFTDFSPTHILDVSLEIRDLMCQSEQMAIDAYVFTGGTWSESTVSWTAVQPNNIALKQDTIYVSYANGVNLSPKHRYPIDITVAARNWASGNYAQNGILLKAGSTVEYGSTYIMKTFASYNRASNKPSLSVTYQVEYRVYRDSNQQDYIIKGKTQQLCSTFAMSSQTVTFSSANEDIADATTTGLIQANAAGDTVITATYTDPIMGVQTTTFNVYVRDPAGLSDGTSYYIMNKASERFLSVANTSDDIGTNVVTVLRTTATTAQWTYDNNSSYLPDGKATLTNVSSPTGKMLDVEGMNIDIWSHTGSGCQHFYIFRSNNQNYEGLYCIRYGPYFVTQDSSYNVILTETATDGSFWSFMKVGKGTVGITSFNYEYIDPQNTTNTKSFDSRMCNNRITGFFENIFDYEDVEVHNNPTVTSSFDSLRNDDIYFYFGHAEAGALKFVKANESGVGITIYAAIATGDQLHSASSYEGGAEFLSTDIDLSQAACVFYFACFSGNDNSLGVSLLEITYEKGAHFVLGSTDYIYSSSIQAFVDALIDRLYRGSNLGEAIENAITDAGAVKIGYNPSGTGPFPAEYIGDTSQYLSY